MTKLHELYDSCGQSPWIDDLKRSYVTAGGLARLAEVGIRGATLNPTIMARSIEAGSDYDAQFGDLMSSGTSVDDAYWDLVIEDVQGALRILRPIFDSSSGGDGFVSIEVSPVVAHDQQQTIEQARGLHERIAQPNLLVKIPATKEGVGAIGAMIAEGRSINVTLIFSLERYAEVMEAYISGLEHFVQGGGNPAQVASVASFFVSRVDTEVDRRLEHIAEAHPGTPTADKALSLRGTAALAQARCVYSDFQTTFSAARFAALKAKGAHLQRPLWASTLTKNPAYPDLLYVDGLIGPDTVNTMPNETVEAFLDHGIVRRTVDADPDAARRTLGELAEVGVDLDDVTAQLEAEAVTSFSKSFTEVEDSLATKAADFGAAH